MPPCIFIPRLKTFNLDISIEDNNGLLALSFYKQTSGHDFVTIKDLKTKIILLNPFFTLLKVSDMPQKPSNVEDDSEESESDKERYIVNGLFGNEDNTSIVRVVLETEDPENSEICDRVIEWRISQPQIDFSTGKNATEIIGKESFGLQVIRSLIYNGVLVAK